MHAPKRLATTLAAAAAVAAAAPAAANADTGPVPANSDAPARVCQPNLLDLGLVRTLGPYSPDRPWSRTGGARVGDVMKCGGTISYFPPGSTPPVFSQIDAQTAGH
jgi:hypothetical protein